MPNTVSSDSVAQDQLRAFIERIERMEEEKAAIADDIKDIYGEAKGNGFDVKVLRQLVRIRKQDRQERMEQEAILELYMGALGMIALPPDDKPPRGRAPVPSRSAAADADTPIQQSPPAEATESNVPRKDSVAEIQPETATESTAARKDVHPGRSEMVSSSQGDGTSGNQAPPVDTIQPETANEVQAQDSGGTALGESLGAKSKAALPASVDANVNDGSHGVDRGKEVVTGGESAATNSPETALDDRSCVSVPGGLATGLQQQATRKGEPARPLPATHSPAPEQPQQQRQGYVLPSPKPLRPHCLRPDRGCGGQGRHHCFSCRKAAEAAGKEAV